MAYVDLLFDPRIAYNSVAGDEFYTTVVQSTSKREQRNQNWSEPVLRIDVAYGAKTLTAINYIQAFHKTMKGRFNTFRFYNKMDNAISAENLGNGNGVIGQTLQLQKTYTDLGGNTSTKTITKPVNVGETDHTLSLSSPAYTTFELKVGGVTKTEGADYSVAYSTGIITSIIAFTSAQAVTVSCSFHYHCRFVNDYLPTAIPSKDGYIIDSIPIVEVKDDL